MRDAVKTSLFEQEKEGLMTSRALKIVSYSKFSFIL